MNEYDIVAAFKAIESELIASMIRNMNRHRAEETKEGYKWSMWQAEQLKALEKYKRDNQKKYKKKFERINKEIEDLIRRARQTGAMKQEMKILQAIKRGWKIHGRNQTPRPDSMTAEFFKLNDRKLEALIEATTHDMKKAETAILRKAEDDYRKAIYNAQVYANTGAGTYEKAVDMAVKDMLSRGLNCVEYKNGARHTLEDYADMAIRTASKRAYLQGEGEKRQEWGISTVIVNKRGNPCPKCLPFCGKVLIDDVWSGGSSEGIDAETGKRYPLMSKAIEFGLYHPRCKDIHTTYFPGISTADDTWTEEELDAIRQNYEKEQKQQYAKRQEEKYERLAGYSLDKENQKQYEKKRKQWNGIKGSSNNESANIENLRKGDNIVKLDEIKSETYRKKFTQITKNSSVNDALRKYANAMLTHRNKSDGEDLYIISAKTGKRLFSKTTGTNELGVPLSDKEISLIKKYATTEGIIGMHNHPTNLLPTGSDFVTAGARGYVFGLVVTHDGRVFLYKTGDKPFRSEYFNKTVDKYISEPYNYDIEKAQMKTLLEFEKEYGIEWKELR